MARDMVSETLPHSDEAERSVLGAILVDNDQFARAREMLSNEAFYSWFWYKQSYS